MGLRKSKRCPISLLLRLRSTPIPFLNGLESNVILLMLINHTLANGQNT
jgi:hypothetical protein